MRKKIIITILVGSFLTFLIFKLMYHETISIVSLGDGLAKGETAYQVTGVSYSDYLRDYYESNNILKEYHNEFTSIDETTETLLLKLQNNYSINKKSINQVIGNAKILTVAIGMDELNNSKELNTETITKYLNNMSKILTYLHRHNKYKIFLISLYPTNKLSLKVVKNINKRLDELSSSNQMTFISIEDINEYEDFFFNPNNYYINYKGHQYISELILDSIE